MTTRERKRAVWLFLAPRLLIFALGAVFGLYVAVRGLSSSDLVDVGLGLVVFSGSAYLAVRLLRATGIY
jgi:ABC-type polysaccharide/polyol phosphate export permease